MFVLNLSFAEKMDSDTQDEVVQRLERVLSQMRPDHSSWVDSHIRLADVLAERARNRFLKEVEKNCENCLGSKKDREKAISLYEKVLKNTNSQAKEIAFFQLAHLYQMKGDNKSAKKYFQEVVNPKFKFDSYRVARAHEGLAGIFYSEKNFSESLKHYKMAQANSEMPNRGYLIYRTGWCLFNLGKIDEATVTFEKLLASRNLLVRKGTQGNEYDPVFHSDVMRDLAIFYSRRKITDFEINKYISFLPNDTEESKNQDTNYQKELMLHFAVEAQRIGNKEASLKIMQHYLKNQLSSEETLEAWMMLASINYGMGLNKQAIDDYEKVAQEWKQKGCNDENKCPALKIRMRNFVTEFHRSQKLNPNKNLVAAYQTYCSLFQDDSKMALTGAQVAKAIDQYDSATLLYHQAAVEAAKKKETETLDKALEGVIEIAEKANNLDLREKAYLFFLELKPNDSRNYSVRYQLAHVEYERKKYEVASSKFHLLAVEKKAKWSTEDKALKKKSADLALDSLVILKRENDIETMSLEFSKEFPSDRLEFLAISRKATVNIVAAITNKKESSTSELEGALDRLKRTPLDGTSTEERKKILNNQFLLAKKVPRLQDAESAIGQLLLIKTLNADEREEYLGRLVWIHEMRFEFRSAYKVALQLKFKNQSESEKQLRLGTLAELAGLNPLPHYRRFVSLGASNYKAAVIRAHMVDISEQPFQEYLKQKSTLRAYPQLLSEVVLSIYVKTQDNRILLEHANLPGIRQMVGIIELENLAHRFSKLRLANFNDHVLKVSISERVQLLGVADKLLKRSSQDWLTQIMAFSIVQRENERLYEELISLPAPKKLKAKQKEQYLNLVAAQSRPFKVKADLAQSKLSEIWSTPGSLEKMESQIRESGGKTHALWVQKITKASAVLKKESSADFSSQLLAMIDSSGSRPSSRDIEIARSKVKSEPFAVSEIERLKGFEDRMGHQVMVTYLDSRIRALEAGVRK